MEYEGGRARFTVANGEGRLYGDGKMEGGRKVNENRRRRHGRGRSFVALVRGMPAGRGGDTSTMMAMKRKTRTCGAVTTWMGDETGKNKPPSRRALASYQPTPDAYILPAPGTPPPASRIRRGSRVFSVVGGVAPPPPPAGGAGAIGTITTPPPPPPSDIGTFTSCSPSAADSALVDAPGDALIVLEDAPAEVAVEIEVEEVEMVVEVEVAAEVEVVTVDVEAESGTGFFFLIPRRLSAGYSHLSARRWHWLRKRVSMTSIGDDEGRKEEGEGEKRKREKKREEEERERRRWRRGEGGKTDAPITEEEHPTNDEGAGGRGKDKSKDGGGSLLNEMKWKARDACRGRRR
ncbi:hypothetical protein C8R43DRAFT_589083 [Mycena crocata]|nr:hypothetical protein C8R43DRAFT_589083 [Mycena crocata]